MDLSANVLAPGALPVESLAMLGPDAGPHVSQFNGGQFVSSQVLGVSGGTRDQFEVALSAASRSRFRPISPEGNQEV